jgi:hypothetical protein
MQDEEINAHTAMLVLACAGAINQQLYRLIDLMNVQIKVYKCLLRKRPRLVDEERCQLAAIAHELERKTLEMAETIVTVDTFRRWYREKIARKYTAKRRIGRPRIDPEIENLIVRLAKENPHFSI